METRRAPLPLVVLTMFALASTGGCNADDPDVNSPTPAAEEMSTSPGPAPAATAERPPTVDDDADRVPVEPESAPELQPEQVGNDTAAELIQPALESTSRLLAAPATLDVSGLTPLVSDEAFRQASAQAQEYAHQGWQQEGSPVVASAQLLEFDQDADPPRAVIEVCLDHSAVDIVNDAGESIVDENAPRRALTIFISEFRDNAWVVVDQTFPVDTSC